MGTAGEDRVDVAIAGAGYAGLALACLCADAGLRVAVLERRPELAPEGVGLVLQPNGLAVLDQLGVLEAVLARGHRVTEARQCDAGGRVRARASYAELDHPHPYLVVVERVSVIDVLAARLGDAGDVRVGCTVEGLEHEGGRVAGLRYRDAAGEVHALEAALVVGADGVDSRVRRALDPAMRWRTRPDRYLIAVSPRPPRHEAVAMLYCGEDWCNGVLPLGERTYFFDHINAENRAAVERGDFAAWRATYARRVPDGDALVDGLTSFDEVAFLSGRTHRAVPRATPGVVLTGDAAAAVHPHNGQGANLALEDALVLGRALARHGPRDDEAIQAWARERDARVRLQVPWSIFIGRTFDGSHAGWRAMRRWGYVMSRVPAVRRATTRRQAGIA